MCLHTSACFSIRQHTSAYVSIRHGAQRQYLYLCTSMMLHAASVCVLLHQHDAARSTSIYLYFCTAMQVVNYVLLAYLSPGHSATSRERSRSPLPSSHSPPPPPPGDRELLSETSTCSERSWERECACGCCAGRFAGGVGLSRATNFCESVFVLLH